MKSKSNILAIVALVLTFTSASGQVQDTCFERLFVLGEQLAAQKGDNYIKALDHFEAARACPDKTNTQERRALEAIRTTRDAWGNALKSQLTIARQEREAKEEERKNAVAERKRADDLAEKAVASGKLAALNGAISEATKLALFADEQTDNLNGEDAVALGYMAMRWAGDSVIQRVAKAYGNAIYLQDRQSFVGSQGAALGIAFKPGSDHYYLRKYNGPVLAYDDLEPTHQLEHSRHTVDFAFDPGGRRMVSIGVDKMLVHEHNSPTPRSVANENFKYTKAVFSPNGGAFVTTGRHGACSLWDRDFQLELEGHEGHITHAEFSPDGKTFLTVATDNIIRVWTSAGILAATLEGHDRYINSAHFSSGSGLIVSAGSDGKAIVWNVAGDQITTFATDGHFTSAEFAPDQQHVLTSSTDGTVALWRIRDKSKQVFDEYNDWVMGAGFLASGHIYSWSRNRQMYIHNSNLEVITQIANPYDGDVSEVIFSSDDMHFLIVQEGRVTLWDINGITWMDPEPFGTHVWAAGFSPDGSKLWASTGTNSTEEAWYCILPRAKDEELQRLQYTPTSDQFETYQIRPLSELPKEGD